MSGESRERERWDAYLETRIFEESVARRPSPPRADPLMDSVRGSPGFSVWGFVSGAVGGMLAWALMSLLGC